MELKENFFNALLNNHHTCTGNNFQLIVINDSKLINKQFADPRFVMLTFLQLTLAGPHPYNDELKTRLLS